MKIIEPKVELIEQVNPIEHVAKCARVCYGKKEGDDDKLYKALNKNRHFSMFRHESVYIIVDNDEDDINEFVNEFSQCPYVEIKEDDDKFYISTNRQLMNDRIIPYAEYRWLEYFTVTPKEFYNTKAGKDLMRFTFKITTQISTSRELNRVSPNAIAERSTRFVYEDGSIVRPWWLKEYDNYKYTSNEYNNYCLRTYLDNIDASFDCYKNLIDNGMNRQDARGVLPLDTATECIYTYSVSEWRGILELRYYGTTGKPHPNAKIIASMIRDKLIELDYIFR